MNLRKIISKIDLISGSPRLYYNGNLKYESFLGGIVTLIIYTLGLASFAYFSLPMIYHNEPYLTTSTTYSNKAKFVLNTSESILAFSVRNYAGLPIDAEDMIEVKGDVNEYYADYDEEKQVYGELKMKYFSLNFTICSEFQLNTTVYNRLYKDWADLKYDFWCLSPNQLIEIKQPLNSEYSSYINVYITRCYNKTNCKSDEEIDKNFNYFSIVSVLTNYYTNGNDYLEPVIPFRQLYVDHVSTHNFKRKYIELENINFQSDDGWIFPNLQNYQYPSIKKTSEIHQAVEPFMDERGFMIFQWTLGFGADGLHSNYFRSYLRLQDIFAKIGGLVQAFRMVSYVLMYFYIDISNTTRIIDNFVLFSKEEHQNFFNSASRIESINNQRLILMCKSSEIQKLRNIGKRVELNSSYNSLLFYRRICCFGRNKQHLIYKLYEKGRELLTQIYFDIVNLIQLKNRLDFISDFVFKDQQEVLRVFENNSQLLNYDKNHHRISRQDITKFLFLNDNKVNE